jgi:hypothetical protein
MAKSKVIRVTPNVLKCAAALKEAVKSLPGGERKARATKALNYLVRTFSGKPQPNKGVSCPADKAIVKLP